jgi:ribonuclease-3
LGNLFSWLLEKLKAREARRSKKYISRLLTQEKFSELEEIIGVSIQEKSYFIQALMHRSFLEQHPEYAVSNERLEFLGDSVLNLAVAEYLFDNFPDKNEGFLTKVRAKLVNKIALAEAGERIKLGNFLLISKNLSSTFNNGPKTVLSDAVEALIGAIYLDSGLEACQNFIQNILIEPNTREGLYLIDENFKSQLLEYAQANKLEIPTYVVVKEEGPQHDRTFYVNAFIGDKEFGKGKGRNKKSAEQAAAKDALRRISGITEF